MEGLPKKEEMVPSMEFLTSVKLIQGGMGAYVSNWRLARAVAMGPDEAGMSRLFQRCPAGPIATYLERRGLERNTEERRCLCNGLMACVGLGQVRREDQEWGEEPAIVTLGNHLDGVRRLSRQGQTPYHAQDVVADILG